MTTAYTRIIEEKEDLSLREFVLRCARACAETFHVRDSTLSSDLPFRVADTSYWEGELSKHIHERSRLADLSDEEARLEALACYERGCAWRAADLAAAQVLRERYERMVDLVETWTPPTPKHRTLKQFMYAQISESVKLLLEPEDLPMPKAEDAREYRARKLAWADNEISFYKGRIAEERSQTEQANAWIRELLASFPEEIAR